MDNMNIRTYIVPATRVLIWVIFDGMSFARPKSEIFGLRSFPRRILLALISLCTIWGRTSSWRNARPRATPTHILNRVRQLNWILLQHCLPPKTKQFSSIQLPFDYVIWVMNSSKQRNNTYKIAYRYIFIQ